MQFFDTAECEYADAVMHLAGARPRKMTGFSFKASKEKEAIHGEGDRPIGIQSGNRTFTGELRFHKGVLDDINKAALAAGGRDALDIAFDVVVTFKAKGARTLQTLTAIGVEITEFEYAMSQGDKSMQITLPVVFLDFKVVGG